jgi:hypothetical protein
MLVVMLIAALLRDRRFNIWGLAKGVHATNKVDNTSGNCGN